MGFSRVLIWAAEARGGSGEVMYDGCSATAGSQTVSVIAAFPSSIHRKTFANDLLGREVSPAGPSRTW